MHRLATGILAAGVWSLALSAQTAPPQPLPGVPQFTAAPRAPVVPPETERALRELLKQYSQRETAVCSIPLLEVPVAKNVDQMPVLRPRAGSIDHMSSVKLPAPPCQEDKR